MFFKNIEMICFNKIKKRNLIPLKHVVNKRPYSKKPNVNSGTFSIDFEKGER
jgi:hypothetical protein